MACKLVRDIKHSCEYNSGGIAQLFLLDIADFKNYVYQDDGLYNSCFVERIRIKRTGYIEFDTVDQSNFTETQDNGVFKQQLNSRLLNLSGYRQ